MKVYVIDNNSHKLSNDEIERQVKRLLKDHDKIEVKEGTETKVFMTKEGFEKWQL